MPNLKYDNLGGRGASLLWRGCWVLAIGVALLPPLAARAQPAGPVGGTGGAPFADHAMPGARLGAIALRTGELIDAIAAVVVLPDGRRVALQPHGGTGGTQRAFPLGEGEYLVAMRVWAGQFVQAIQFETNRRVSAVYGRPEGAPRRLVVPQGSEAVGFIGRAGDYVDAIGFALQARSSLPPTPHGQSGGFDSGSQGAPPMPPRPAPAVGRVELDGPVRQMSSTTSSLTLEVRLKQPALLTVNLGPDRPRSGQCFGPQDRGVLRFVSPTAQTSHTAPFKGLSKNTSYHYSIPVDGGKCVSGIASTATCTDTERC